MTKRSVLVVAGEPSGDQHAANVVRELRALAPDVTFFGIGGDRLRAEGVEILQDARDMAVMGFVEVMKRYSFFRKVFFRLLEAAKERKPDAVLLIDYPGFNLEFAERAHKLGFKVVYYVCPQVWAWHRSRIARIARIVDRLLVIFPFEVDVFRDTGLRVEFVGHPLIEVTEAARHAPDAPLPWRGTARIAMLPGSRRQELERILPAMLGAAAQLEQQRPDASFILAAASEQMEAIARELYAANPVRPSRFEIVRGQTREILKQARTGWVTSGTATLETALMDCPMIVVYKTAPMTYQAAKRLIRVPHIGMVNLIAGRELCPELIQHEASPDRLASAIAPLLDDTPERAAMKAGLAEVRQKLGGGGAAHRVAAALLDEIGSSP